MSKPNMQPVINPATGEMITQVALRDAWGVDEVIAGARKAFDAGPWPRLPLHKRKELILKLAEGIKDKAGELASLETLNTGKPIKETTFMDVPSAAASFEYCANNLERYLETETLKVTNATAALRRMPQGVVVLIVPWNYPLLIASWKMSQALAAGNTVIVKPSSLTPLTALELETIARDAGFPDGVVTVLHGSGDTIGEVLCSDPRVDMVSFTGSNAVGKKIIRYTERHVKKLVMELGGKSASIVCADADLELAVNGSLCSVFLNQGQMCTAMSRIIVANSVYDAFVADFLRKTKQIKLGMGADFQTQMGPLISETQRASVLRQIEQAQRDGATVLCGGKVPSEEALKSGFFFEPTVLGNVSPAMRIFQEEVFGPVTCITRFSDIDDAVALANATDFGLAACVWSTDTTRSAVLAEQLQAGTVWLNTYGMFYPELPYGGIKQSGFGKELGREGFLEYTRLQNIFIDQTENAKPLVNYWYGF